MGALALVGLAAGALRKKPKAPQALDPAATAAAQAQANMQAAQQTATLNRPNQSNPFSNMNWSQDPNDPNKWSSSVTLTPEMQQLFGNSMGQGNQTFANGAVQAPGALDINSMWRQSMDRYNTGIGADNANAASQTALGALNYDGEGKPPLPIADNEMRQRVEDAYYNQSTSRLDPRFELAQRRLDTKLANQGITQGSMAHGTEQGLFAQDRNDAYNTAMNSAITNSTSEMKKLFDMALASRQQSVNETNMQRTIPFSQQMQMAQYGLDRNAGMENSALKQYGLVQGNNQQAFDNSAQGRQNVLNELLKIQGLTTGGLQGNTNVAGVNPAPVTDIALANQAQNNSIYNANMNSRNGLINAMAGLGGAWIGAM